MKPTVLLINPWIFDFAAYDLWAKPLGLLQIATFLRRAGFHVALIDCLDPHHHGMAQSGFARSPKRGIYGTGKFLRQPIDRPQALMHVERTYSRYGISTALFEKALGSLERPSAILVTSMMTYWYPGVRETIRTVKRIHPKVPVILGGIYARLCPDHALMTADADVVTGEGSVEAIRDLLSDLGLRPRLCTDRSWHPYPAFDLLRPIDYVCLRTSSGCPYRCAYCASPFLDHGFTRRHPDDVLGEILYWYERFSVRDFAFYDDALLIRGGGFRTGILEPLIRKGLPLRFHAPNGLHAREIDPLTAKLLYRSGFKTIRLGFESADFPFRQGLDNKLAEGEFEKAVCHLKGAGYKAKEIGAYILMGLPGQTVRSVAETVRAVAAAGGVPYLAEYSPIPHTGLWARAVAASEYDIAEEPIFHNNTLLPCWDEDQRRQVPTLRQLVAAIRHRVGNTIAG
jgi:radical SAM superfamily enzyme YgiQ (UPF0313 family)